MKIAISNIAWDHKQDDQIIEILSKFDIRGLEIAPTKIWPDPVNTSLEEINRYRQFWLKKNIRIIAMQSLLYRHPELTIFENAEARQNTQKYLCKIIKLAGKLGVKNVVLGSPTNRKTYGLNYESILKIAKDFFYKIADVAQANQLNFCIEPNPKEYGTDFVTNTDQAIQLVEIINHPHFRLHLDSGAMALNKENYHDVISRAIKYTTHFHISEDNLILIGQGLVNHETVANSLKKNKYQGWVSIEMRSKQDDSDLKNVEDSLKLVTSIYR